MIRLIGFEIVKGPSAGRWENMSPVYGTPRAYKARFKVRGNETYIRQWTNDGTIHVRVTLQAGNRFRIWDDNGNEIGYGFYNPARHEIKGHLNLWGKSP